MVLNFHTVGKRRPISTLCTAVSVSDSLCHHEFKQLQLLCCWPDSAIVWSWPSGGAQLSGTSYSPSVNPQKTWRHFPSWRVIVRRSSWVRRLAFRLPPYDTPHVAPHNNPEFHVDHRHTAGGVCEQTTTALQKYIGRLGRRKQTAINVELKIHSFHCVQLVRTGQEFEATMHIYSPLTCVHHGPEDDWGCCSDWLWHLQHENGVCCKTFDSK